MLRALRLRHVYTSMLKPRPYQDMCLESCLDALEDGSTKTRVSLPPEAGKSVTFWDGYKHCPETPRRLALLSSSSALSLRDRRRIGHGKASPTGLLKSDKGLVHHIWAS